jgi:hypothetical protein
MWGNPYMSLRGNIMTRAMTFPADYFVSGTILVWLKPFSVNFRNPWLNNEKMNIEGLLIAVPFMGRFEVYLTRL